MLLSDKFSSGVHSRHCLGLSTLSVIRRCHGPPRLPPAFYHTEYSLAARCWFESALTILAPTTRPPMSATRVPTPTTPLKLVHKVENKTLTDSQTSTELLDRPAGRRCRSPRQFSIL